jgi:ribA/ribD-fused uncharacterized protein
VKAGSLVDEERITMKTIESFTGDHRFLSNFYPCEIFFEGCYYRSVEYAYQAAKTLVQEERDKIRVAKTPGEAKRLGRKVTLQVGWDAMRVAVMRELLQKKFSDNVLKAMLLETGDAGLVEGNYWGDTFYGVCKGRGENNLGKLLMEIRKEVAQK